MKLVKQLYKKITNGREKKTVNKDVGNVCKGGGGGQGTKEVKLKHYDNGHPTEKP